MGYTEQIMFNEKVGRHYSYSKKHDFEHLQTFTNKVGDTFKLKKSRLDVRSEVTVEPLIIHLGESDDDSD
jgi:hypothetical protein